jgi:hypothetical protein
MNEAIRKDSLKLFTSGIILDKNVFNQPRFEEGAQIIKKD